MEELLNYLIEQKEERTAKIEAFYIACKELEEAKEKFAAFGDMSGAVEEVSKLNEFIERVSYEIGAVDDGGYQGVTEEVASDGAVTDGEEA